MKQKSPKWYKSQVDDIRSVYIRRRDANWRGRVMCFTCPRVMDWKESDAGHFHLRQHDFTTELAGDERNLQAQCGGCNRYMRGRPQVFALGLIRKYGEKVLEELEKKYRTPKKWKIKELQNLLEEYKHKLSIL